MAIIHFSRREIEARIVYWGPAMSGKTTSLKALHAFAPRGRRGALQTLDTLEERTLYFDYLPLMWGSIAGFQGRVKVVGVPGQPLYHQTRRLLLQGADGVVFVADSGAQRLSANVESLAELQRSLAALGRSLDELPVLLQYNKRDLPDALPVKVLQLGLNPRDLPWFETVATDGTGVGDAFQAMFDLVSRRVEQELATGERGGLVVGARPEDQVGPDEEVRRTLEAVVAVRTAEDAGTPEPPPAAEPEPTADPTGDEEPSSTEEAEAPIPADRGGDAEETTEEPAAPPSSEPPGFETTPAREPPALPPLAPPDDLAPAVPTPSPPPDDHTAAAPAPPVEPEAVSDLACLPAALAGCRVEAAETPVLEPGGVVRVALALRHPEGGAVHKLCVRLLPVVPEPPVRAFEPAPAPEEYRLAMLLLALAAGFGLGAAVVWWFLS
jgi:signal recognition particle receptor subunit beta